MRWGYRVSRVVLLQFTPHLSAWQWFSLLWGLITMEKGGVLDFGSAACCGGLGQEPQDACERVLPMGGAASWLIRGTHGAAVLWLVAVRYESYESTLLYQKLMSKGKSDSSRPHSLPQLFFQCK